MELVRFVFGSAKTQFVQASIAGVGSGLSVVILLGLINKAINDFESVNFLFALSFFVVALVMVALRITSIVLLEKLSQESTATLRLRLSKQVLDAPLESLEKHGTHKLIASLSTDVSAISVGIMRLPFLMTNVAVLLGCLAYMLWLSQWLFFISLTLMVLGIVVYRIPQLRALSLYKLARSENDSLFKCFRAICEGIKDFKMNTQRRDSFMDNKLKPILDSYSENMIGGTRYYSYAAGMGLIAFFLLIGAVIFVFPRFFEVPTETLIGYVIILLFIQGPMEGIMNVIPELAKTSVSLDKIRALGFGLTQAIEDESKFEEGRKDSVNINYNKPIEYRERVELKDVVHNYYRESEDNYFQIGPINLSLKPGEIVFLLGGNGSGKTTLAKILLGLYQPKSGEISVDGQFVTREYYDVYRQLFSAVFSDFFLFDDIKGLTPTNLDAQARDFIEHLQLSHKVSVADGELSNVDLSQGQRKRLTLVAAYLEDRPIYIFDEWAADQDPEFKHVFYTEILSDLKRRGKTVLVITHDDKYFDRADRCLKLDSGQLVEL